MVEALITIPLVGILGAVLLLERRCLGQIAFVQPLVLCAATGWVTGNEEIGIWVGVSLQLMSVGQGHYADWALAGYSGAAAIWIGERLLAVPLAPGSPESIALVGTAVVCAIAARSVERRFAMTDGITIRSKPPWDGANAAKELEQLTRRRIFRGWAVGAVEALAASGVSTTAIWGATLLSPPQSPVDAVARLAVPAIGMAVALGSLAGYRFVGYAAAGVVSTAAMTVLI